MSRKKQWWWTRRSKERNHRRKSHYSIAIGGLQSSRVHEPRLGYVYVLCCVAFEELSLHVVDGCGIGFYVEGRRLVQPMHPYHRLRFWCHPCMKQSFKKQLRKKNPEREKGRKKMAKKKEKI